MSFSLWVSAGALLVSLVALIRSQVVASHAGAAVVAGQVRSVKSIEDGTTSLTIENKGPAIATRVRVRIAEPPEDARWQRKREHVTEVGRLVAGEPIKVEARGMADLDDLARSVRITWRDTSLRMHSTTPTRSRPPRIHTSGEPARSRKTTEPPLT